MRIFISLIFTDFQSYSPVTIDFYEFLKHNNYLTTYYVEKKVKDLFGQPLVSSYQFC